MPRVVHKPGEGEALFGGRIVIKANFGELCITESLFPDARPGADPHFHRQHADSFYVLEGGLAVLVHDEEKLLSPGACVCAPPDVVHGFRSTSRARFLNFHTPDGGFARSLQERDRGEPDKVARMTVIRRGGASGTVSVRYHTIDRNYTAGVHYVPTSGTLTFGPGETLKTIEIPLVDDSVFRGFDSFDAPPGSGLPGSDAVFLPPGEGERLEGKNRIATIKIGRDELSLIEFELEPGFEGPDPHTHDDHVDSFYVLEGEPEFLAGDERLRLGAGSYVAAPIGVVHTFSNPGPDRTRLLNIHAPSHGFHDALRRMS